MEVDIKDRYETHSYGKVLTIYDSRPKPIIGRLYDIAIGITYIGVVFRFYICSIGIDVSIGRNRWI